jgi:hypothetical protein
VFKSLTMDNKQKVLDEITVKCIDCNMPLAIITVTESNESRANKGLKPIISKCQAFCDRCNSRSLETKLLYGTTCIQPGNHKIDISVLDSDILDNGIIFTKINTKVL